MVQVRLISNAMRKTITVDEDTTIRQVLEDNSINYSTTTVFLDGAPLGIGEHDQTFAELGLTEKCNLSAVVKAENA